MDRKTSIGTSLSGSGASRSLLPHSLRDQDALHLLYYGCFIIVSAFVWLKVFVIFLIVCLPQQFSQLACSFGSGSDGYSTDFLQEKIVNPGYL